MFVQNVSEKYFTQKADFDAGLATAIIHSLSVRSLLHYFTTTASRIPRTQAPKTST